MKRIFALIFVCGMVAQIPAQTPFLSVKLTITDDVGGSQELTFGIDTTATDGLDASLEENELPPFPPTGIFEARFIGDDIDNPALGLGTYADYRWGGANFSGSTTHEIIYQAGNGGNQITLSWAFPEGVTAQLEDFLGGVVVNQAMSDSGTYTVTNLAVNKLKMTVTFDNVTSVAQFDDPLPGSFRLLQNYPNPFNPATTIAYTLPKNGHVRLSVFDVLGREVALLVDTAKPVGNHQLSFDASELSTGLYFYRITTGTFRQTRRMLLLK